MKYKKKKITVKTTWRIPFFHKKIRRIKLVKGRYLLMFRNSVIMPNCVGSTVRVYNGRKFLPILITKFHVGFKFGEFCFTRLIGSGQTIHINKKKRVDQRKKWLKLKGKR